MEGVFILLCIAAVPLMMWGMVIQRRRVRERMREQDAPELDTDGNGYVDEVRGPDGMSYGHRLHPLDAVPDPDHRGGELGGVNALHGRR